MRSNSGLAKKNLFAVYGRARQKTTSPTSKRDERKKHKTVRKGEDGRRKKGGVREWAGKIIYRCGPSTAQKKIFFFFGRAPQGFPIRSSVAEPAPLVPNRFGPTQHNPRPLIGCRLPAVLPLIVERVSSCLPVHYYYDYRPLSTTKSPCMARTSTTSTTNPLVPHITSPAQRYRTV